MPYQRTLAKRFKFVILAAAGFLYFFTSPTSAAAAPKMGIHIGDHYPEFSQAANAVGQDGWIVTLGGPGNCGNFQKMFDQINSGQVPSVNIIIRAYNGGRYFDENHALAWIATLGSLNTYGRKVFFMPWNEPFQNVGGRFTESQPLTSKEAIADKIVAYTSRLVALRNDTGLHGKIVLLSPMFNQFNHDLTDSVGKIKSRDPGFFSKFDGIAMNLYGEFDRAGGQPVSDPIRNGQGYRSHILRDIYGVSGARVYAVESGIGIPGGTFIKYGGYENEIATYYSSVHNRWSNDDNFNMFAIFSYDPHGGSGGSIYSAQNVLGAMRNIAGPRQSFGRANYDQIAFEGWRDALVAAGELVECDNVCGYAPQGYCFGTGWGGIMDCNSPISGPGGDQCGKRWLMERSGNVTFYWDELLACADDPASCTSKTIGMPWQGTVKVEGLSLPGRFDELSERFIGTADEDGLIFYLSSPDIADKLRRQKEELLANVSAGTLQIEDCGLRITNPTHEIGVPHIPGLYTAISQHFYPYLAQSTADPQVQGQQSVRGQVLAQACPVEGGCPDGITSPAFEICPLGDISSSYSGHDEATVRADEDCTLPDPNDPFQTPYNCDVTKNFGHWFGASLNNIAYLSNSGSFDKGVIESLTETLKIFV
ncbi:hypothetical protein L6258_00005, partial [Candidatus Parcubacteria bacterium]|nr:hypothetical protein [Candidatus Parcubacteria bacterium]